jgi:UDP-2,3-diacylglucosamine pyrophosphatase LpxH
MKNILYTKDSMMHKFQKFPKIMDYENNIYYITANQDFHLLGLFKYKHSKKLNFPTLFYGQP